MMLGPAVHRMLLGRSLPPMMTGMAPRVLSMPPSFSMRFQPFSTTSARAITALRHHHPKIAAASAAGIIKPIQQQHHRQQQQQRNFAFRSTRPLFAEPELEFELDEFGMKREKIVFEDPKIYKLSKNELRKYLLDRLTPVIAAVTKQDGYVPEKMEWFMFGDKSLRERIFRAVQRSFGREIPSFDQNLIMTVRDMLQWLMRRVRMERPEPDLEVPPVIKVYIRTNRLQRLERIDAKLKQEEDQLNEKIHKNLLRAAQVAKKVRDNLAASNNTSSSLTGKDGKKISASRLIRAKRNRLRIYRIEMRKQLRPLTKRREKLGIDLALIRTMLGEARTELEQQNAATEAEDSNSKENQTTTTTTQNP